MTAEERESVLAHRKQLQRPWHTPPHPLGGAGEYHLTAACYEHKVIIGLSPKRMDESVAQMFEALADVDVKAWCLLRNHYHLFVKVEDLRAALSTLGRLHGRTAFDWNGSDGTRGRRVWHSIADRQIRNEAHGWATLNYIHHNPVRHGYVEKWQDWAWSSARAYLAEVGHQKAAQAWRAYPVLEYGAGWDDACL